ncbi:MAG: hypothetical protein AAFP00_11120 [Bacteroidota bacterium]
MAVTRLQRKERKNKTRATQRKVTIKRLLATPTIKKEAAEVPQEAPAASEK